jgi:catechol 2,3-dioxygenase-like lactoylglutathione lyase family enzyme
MQPSKRGLDAGIVTNDASAALAFYVDALGLELVEELSIPWGTMHRLRFGDSWLKLVVPSADAPTGTRGGIDGATGIRYLTFEIDDVHAVWQRATAAGATPYHDLGPFGTKGVVMGMLLDPDGNVVELLHRPATAAVPT